MSDVDNIIEPQPAPPVVEALQLENLRTFLHFFDFDVTGEDIAPIPAAKPHARASSVLRLATVLVDLARFPTWILEWIDRRWFRGSFDVVHSDLGHVD